MINRIEKKRLFCLFGAYFIVFFIFISSSSCYPYHDGKRNGITIELDFTESDIPDTAVVLHFWHHLHGIQTSNHTPVLKILGTKNSLGFIEFTVQPKFDYGYFSLSIQAAGSYVSLLSYYLVEKGDRIRMTMEKHVEILPGNEYLNKQYYTSFFHFPDNHIKFSGIGSEKYGLRYQLDTAAFKYGGSRRLMSTGKYNVDNSLDYLQTISLNILEDSRDRITPLAFDLILGDILGRFHLDRLNILNRQNYLMDFNDYLPSHLNPMIIYHKLAFDKTLKIYSPFFLESMLEGIRSVLNHEHQLNVHREIYDRINLQYESLDKERLQTLALLTFRDRYEDQQQIIDELLNSSEAVMTKYTLSHYADKFLKGAPVYNFRLTNSEGHMVSLDDIKGKVVLMDFWFTGCGACKHYYKTSLKPLKELYVDSDEFQVVSVSVDKSFNRWKSSIGSNLYTSEENVINLYTNGEGVDNNLITYYGLTGFPSTIIFDRNAEIHHIYNRQIPTFDKLVEDLRDVL